MRHARKYLFPMLALIATITGCGKGANDARVELAQMNVPFTDMAFIDNARQGNTAAVELFLKAGMDSEVRNAEGQTPLLAATLAGKFDVVKLLAENGGDINATNKYKGTPLMTAAWTKNESIFNFLLESKAKVDVQDNTGMTALMFAAWENQEGFIKALLGRRANIELRDENGWTALMRAAFNGRTCATCHRENANMTIDQEFITTLPPNDPLFVAEFNPNLAVGFEQPVLMRKFALILENPDGFMNPGVMRGVPHTLALLQNTLTPVAGGGDGTTTPPNERTDWGGDGAPGTGTLREFIIGAVIQHYPKTLSRQVGNDFILPTVAQLDALEAFQKSLGRRADLNLSTLSLKSELAKRGQQIFLNPGNVLDPSQSNAGAGKCFFCHLNAGASDFFFPGANANFNTNVEGLPFQPADLVPGASVPPDGGFGGTGTSPTGGIGNGSFNTPVLVEAADTPPFFYNNAIGTIEGAVDFYNSKAFNEPPGFGALIGGIRLEAVEVEAVAAFLRVINALENVRSADDLALRARSTSNTAAAKELLGLSIAELVDTLEVLTCASLHPEAQIKVIQAGIFLQQAIDASTKSARDGKINQARPLIAAARAEMRN